MRHGRLCMLALVVLGLIASGARPADAQTFVVGPYYPTPSWDQTVGCLALGLFGDNCPRFVVLNNFGRTAAMDRETGLVWERSPAATARTWVDAELACNNRTVGKRAGWRLPTVQELASLADLSEDDPVTYLPPGHPFVGAALGFYWSATTSANDAGKAWSVNLRPNGLYEFVVLQSDMTTPLYVWCVRGGRGVDAQ